jgi:hypothetical protein
MAGKLKGKIVTPAKRNEGEKMTVAELMHHNFDKIFIELDPVKREAMSAMLIQKIAYGYTRVAAWSALRRSMRQHRKFVSTSRSTATRWLAIFTRCTMSGCAVGGADFLANRSAIPVRTFWRNATAVWLCSTPSSIVELPGLVDGIRPSLGWKTWLARRSAVRYLPDCCCEPSSPALSGLVSGWITTYALFLSQAIVQYRRVPNRQCLIRGNSILETRYAVLSRIEIRIGKPKDLSLLICLKAAPESHVLLLQVTLLQSLAAALNILLPGASFGSPIAAACVRDQGPPGGIVGVGLRPAL